MQLCRPVVDGESVTAPRLIRKGMTFYLTVRATNRSFRFVPTRSVVESISYALAAVAQRFRDEGRLVLHEFCFMSNHFHILGTDHAGCLPEFVRDFDSLLSRQLNALRGVNGSNIEKGAGIVQVECEERIVEHAVYTLANPVAAFLVTSARRWPGLHSSRLEYGVPVVIARPNRGLWSRSRKSQSTPALHSGRARFSGRTKLPEKAQLVIDRPPVLSSLTDAELRRSIRKQLREREDEIASERLAKGRRVLGRRAVRSVHFLQIPAPEAMFARNPTFSASSREERARLAQRYVQFVQSYRQAARAFFAGHRGVVFPEGTYLWRCRFGVACIPAASD